MYTFTHEYCDIHVYILYLPPPNPTPFDTFSLFIFLTAFDVLLNSTQLIYYLSKILLFANVVEFVVLNVLPKLLKIEI